MNAISAILFTFMAFQVPYPTGNGVSAQLATYHPQPEIPQSAKDAHIEGEVMLSIVIDENGVPAEVSVKQGVDPALDSSAVETIKTWRFKPGMKDGKPVAVRADISVMFHLQ